MFGKFFTVAAIFAASFSFAAEMPSVKYVFLFIGDGMSYPQRQAAEQFETLANRGGLVINSFPHQAPTRTSSANSFITDSAAAGTAIACGDKTDNGRLGTRPDGSATVSIAEVAKKSGKKVGIITSVTINHATPGAFYAHVDKRSQYYKIALQMIDSGFDYFGGGGIASADDSKNKLYKGNAYTLAEKAGYKVFRFDESATAESLKKVSGEKVMCFGAEGALPYAIDNKGSLKLADFTKLGIELLKDAPKGFFMMVEGGKIDWACHANDAATAVREVADMDAAVRAACEFAKAHPDETLIVITGDHETGGMALGCEKTHYDSHMNLLAGQKMSAENFSAIAKKSLKKNPDASFEEFLPLILENFGFSLGAKSSGAHSEKSIAYVEPKFDSKKAADDAKLTALDEDELASLKKAFEIQKKNSKKKNAISAAAASILDAKSGIGWSSSAHSALFVNTTAQGRGSEFFEGRIENTDISKLLKKAVK